MRTAAGVARIALTAFSFTARGETNGRGLLGPPVDYRKARHIRTLAFL
jgi:hypothetical protein